MEQNQDKIHKIINDVFISSLQEIGFVDVIPSTNENLEKTVCAKISILMPFLNELYLAFTPKLAEEIAQNALGPMFSKDKINDIIGEFANVYAGKMIEALTPSILFELGYPEVVGYESISKDEYITHTFITPNNEKAQLFRKFQKIE